MVTNVQTPDGLLESEIAIHRSGFKSLRVVISTIFFFPLGTSYTISGLKIRLDGISMRTILVIELVRDFLMGHP